MLTTLAKNGAALSTLCVLSADVALAQSQAPSAIGSSFVAIAIIVGLVLVIFFLISGALNLSQRNADEDDEGTILEGIEDEDDKPRRRR